MDLLKKRYLYLMAGFIAFLFMGVGLAWGILVVPIEQLFGWTRAETSMVFTVNILCFSVGSILAGSLSKHLSFTTLLKISAMMIFAGFFASSMIQSLWQLYITYGIVVGTGIGMGYMCVLSSCPVWMPEKNATATGLLLMGYALSTAVFGPVLNTLISSVGIVTTFKILGAVCGGAIFICSFFIKIPSLDDLALLPAPPKKASGSRAIITSEMVKMSVFWIYFVMTIIFAGTGLAIVNHNAPMMTEGLKASAATASLIISITSIVNGVGRLGWGILFDRLGVEKCLSMISGLFMVALTGLFIAYQSSNMVLYVICACLLMVPYGGNATTCPAVVRTLFGNRTFSLNYSVLSLNAIFASFFPSLIGMIQTATHGYHMPILVLGVVSVIGFACTMIFVKLVKKMK